MISYIYDIYIWYIYYIGGPTKPRPLFEKSCFLWYYIFNPGWGEGRGWTKYNVSLWKTRAVEWRVTAQMEYTNKRTMRTKRTYQHWKRFHSGGQSQYPAEPWGTPSCRKRCRKWPVDYQNRNRALLEMGSPSRLLCQLGFPNVVSEKQREVNAFFELPGWYL